MCQICWNIQNTISYCSSVIYMLFSLFSVTREFTESICLQHVKCKCKQASQSYLYSNKERMLTTHSFHFWKLSSKRKYHMYFRSALLMPDLVFLKRITWITSSKRWMIPPVVLKWKLWLLLLCLNCSHMRYWSIFHTKIISQNKIPTFFFFFADAEIPVPFLLHVLPFNFYFSTVFLFTGRISLLYLPSLISALSCGSDRANEHSTLCISLILNPDHSKSVLCSQGLCSWAGSFCFGCFIAPGMTHAIWHTSPPLHSDHLLLALKSKWKFVSIPNLIVVS